MNKLHVSIEIRKKPSLIQVYIENSELKLSFVFLNYNYITFYTLVLLITSLMERRKGQMDLPRLSSKSTSLYSEDKQTKQQTLT